MPMPASLMNLFLPVIASTVLAATQPDALEADIAWVSAGEFCEPETVLPLPDDTLLVSNVCDFATPGTGFLTLLNASGEVLDWQIVAGLDSPLGMAMSGDQLYVVDNNHVRVFRWPGYKLLHTYAMETRVANDVAVAADGSIYVTDSAQHQVVKRLPDGELVVVAPNFRFQNANGLELAGEHLYVGGARLWQVDLRNSSVQTIGPEWLADIDGIEFEDDGTLQLTPVGGPLVRYRDTAKIEIFAGEGVSSANHGYAPNLRLALIPTGYDNTVIAIRVPAKEQKDDK